MREHLLKLLTFCEGGVIRFTTWKMAGQERILRGRQADRNFGSKRRVRSEDPRRFVENTLSEIRKKDTKKDRISSDEIDRLLDGIREGLKNCYEIQ